MYLRETLRMTHFQRKVVFQDPWAKLLKSKAKEGSWPGAKDFMPLLNILKFLMDFQWTCFILHPYCIHLHPQSIQSSPFFVRTTPENGATKHVHFKTSNPAPISQVPSALPDINCQPHMFSSPSSKLRSATPYFDDYPMWEVAVNHLQYTSLYIQQYFTAIKFKWSLEYRTQRSHWSDVHCNMGQSPRFATSGRAYFYTGCGWKGDPIWLS